MKTSLKLNNGSEMPMVGYGMWQSDTPEELESALNTALAVGYRHFDTAWGYRNEDVFGRVLKKWFAEGKVKREELFIVTKLPPTGNHPDRIELYLLDSLKALQLDYVDLYLIHNPATIKTQPDGFTPVRDANGRIVVDTSATLEQSWWKLEEQVTLGRCKAIGLSNFSPEQVIRICKCAKSIKPANHQVELNASYPRKELRKVCAANGVTVTAFAPLGSPGRKIYKGYTATGADSIVPIPPLLTDPVVTRIAGKHGKTPAQVLLRFLGQLDIITLAKSVNADRIKSNFALTGWELDSQDMADLDGLDLKVEGGTWGFDWKNALGGIEDHPEFQLAG
ncbi:1,5-anhydro-D-fructose reductase [Folsomia candida]|nr:1,5-anhydro-D-fructose reductase [Folsomia candida]